MKRKDIFTFVAIAIVAAVLSSIIAGAIFTSEKQRSEKVPVVEPISGNFPAVSSDSQYQAIFNKNALNPTQLIKIGTSQNTTPFSDSQ